MGGGRRKTDGTDDNSEAIKMCHYHLHPPTPSKAAAGANNASKTRWLGWDTHGRPGGRRGQGRRPAHSSQPRHVRAQGAARASWRVLLLLLPTKSGAEARSAFRWPRARTANRPWRTAGHDLPRAPLTWQGLLHRVAHHSLRPSLTRRRRCKGSWTTATLSQGPWTGPRSGVASTSGQQARAVPRFPARLNPEQP